MLCDKKKLILSQRHKGKGMLKLIKKVRKDIHFMDVSILCVLNFSILRLFSLANLCGKIMTFSVYLILSSKLNQHQLSVDSKLPGLPKV
jgi:Ca2+/Na+ antiporter